MKVVFDRNSGALRITMKKMVVRRPDPDDPGQQISFDEAVKKYPDVELGDDVEVEDDPFRVFSRIASQTAKQVMMQKIKELEEGLSTEFDVRAKFGEPERIWQEATGIPLPELGERWLAEHEKKLQQ